MNHQSRISRTIDRLGIVRILLVQVMVLLALVGAVVRWVNWSSEVAWEEFLSASRPALAGASSRPQPPPQQQSQSQSPVQTVKSKAACPNKV
jgi:flagellar basal body-associated protein FliL